MELGAHYLAKLELIIMFHGALRKFRSITYTNAMVGGGGGDEGEDTKQRGFILENFERFHDHTFNLKNMYMLIFLNYNPF